MRAAAGLLCLALTLPGAAANEDTDGLVLARVNGEAVTLAQIKADFKQRHQGHMALLGDEEVVREFLASAIGRRLFVQEAYRMELQDDPEIRALVDRERERIAGRWLHRIEVEEKVEIPDEQIDRAVRLMGLAYEIVRIETDTEEQARSARKRVLSGEGAQNVAREVSVARSGTRGGLEGLGWGQSDEALERVVLSAAVGDVTPVVPTESGFAFAKITGRQEIEVTRVEDARRRAEQVLRRRAEVVRRDAYLDQLRKRYNAVLYTDRLAPADLRPLLEGERKDDPTVVAEYDGRKLTRGEFAESIRARAYLELRPPQQKRQAVHLLDNRVDEALIGLEGRRRWAEAPAEARTKIQVVEEDLLYRSLVVGYVYRDLAVSDEQIRAWHEEHPERYVVPTRVKLAIALLSTESEALGFLEEVRAGADFGMLARERSQDRQSAAHGGVAGWVSKDRAIPELRERPFELAAGECGGPVEIEKGWLVYKVLERVEARQLELQQVEGQIREELIEQKRAERMDRWAARLREVGEVEVLDQAVEKASLILGTESAERMHESPEDPVAPANPHGSRPTNPHGGGR